jgi:methyl-accepting chemotaxis protein
MAGGRHRPCADNGDRRPRREHEKRRCAASKRIDDESLQAFHDACVMLVCVALCALSRVAFLSGLLAYSITAPISRAVKVAQAVAEGNLSTEVIADSRDETGKLLTALGVMNGQLRDVVNTIRVGSTEISTSTKQIASGNQDLFARTSEQAAALEETAASMQEFTDSVNANARRAHEASSLAESASTIARQSSTAMTEAVGAMTQVQNVASALPRLRKPWIALQRKRTSLR